MHCMKTRGTKTRSKKRARLTPPKSKKPRKPFPFLSLPQELRDYIYELALTEEEGLTLVSRTKAYRRTICRGVIYNNDGTRYYRRYRRRRFNTARLSQSQEDEKANHLSPNLLAVNKQIHAEAIGYLYKQPMIVDDTMTLHTFLAAIGASNRLALSDVTVKAWGVGRGTHKAMNFASLTLLATCTNLTRLSLDCEVGWMRQPKYLARQIFRDGHYFLETFGAANGKKDAAIDVLELSEWNYDKGNFFPYRRLAGSLPEKEPYKEAFRAELRKLLRC